MIQAMKSPALVAARYRARGETQNAFTLPIRTAFVKQAIVEHGPDFAVLLVVLAFIGFATI
jgi:hypothetical protein